MSELRRLHAFISGQVQGVGFRWHSRRAAERLGLRGWVTNLADGRVEFLAEGSPAQLESMLAWLRRGSPSSQVEEVQFDYEAATGEFSEFESRR